MENDSKQSFNVPKNINLEQKNFNIQVKEIEDEDSEWLYFTAYASVFGNIDLGNDIIEKGSFTDWLRDNKSFPVLFNHDWDKVIGIIISAKEDSKGLIVKGKISKTQNTDASRTVIDGILKGYINELSIGFSINKATWEDMKSPKTGRTIQVRKISSVFLYEISMVTKAMNPEAQLLDFKSLEKLQIKDTRTLEKSLKDLGLSGSEAKTLISICKNALSSEVESKLLTTRDEELVKAYKQGRRDADLQVIKTRLESIIKIINNN